MVLPLNNKNVWSCFWLNIFARSKYRTRKNGQYQNRKTRENADQSDNDFDNQVSGILLGIYCHRIDVVYGLLRKERYNYSGN